MLWLLGNPEQPNNDSCIDQEHGFLEVFCQSSRITYPKGTPCPCAKSLDVPKIREDAELTRVGATIDVFRYHTRSGAAGSESHSQRTNRFGLDPETWVIFSSVSMKTLTVACFIVVTTSAYVWHHGIPGGVLLISHLALASVNLSQDTYTPLVLLG